MTPSINNLRDTISKINPRDLFYPGIVLLFIIIVGILFSLSTKFIATNINSAFSGDTGAESSSLNMTNYTIVAKKLGFNTGAGTSTQAVESTVPTEAPSAQALNLKSLTIAVLNSTVKTGVATTLAKSLEASGFAKATTGNEKKLYATTTVIVRETKKDYATSLLDAVRKIYPSAIAATTTTGTIDATIIIGSH